LAVAAAYKGDKYQLLIKCVADRRYLVLRELLLVAVTQYILPTTGWRHIAYANHVQVNKSISKRTDGGSICAIWRLITRWQTN